MEVVSFMVGDGHKQSKPLTKVDGTLYFVSRLSSKIMYVCSLDIIQEDLEYKAY